MSMKWFTAIQREGEERPGAVTTMCLDDTIVFKYTGETRGLHVQSINTVGDEFVLSTTLSSVQGISATEKSFSRDEDRTTKKERGTFEVSCKQASRW